MEAPGYWDDVEKSQEGMKELNRLKEEKQAFEGLQRSYEDIETLLEMGYEENDESLIPEIEEELNQFVETFESMRIRTLLSGEYDKEDAIVTLHAGAGGDGVLRLDRHALPDVQPLGGVSWIFRGGAGLSGRR